MIKAMEIDTKWVSYVEFVLLIVLSMLRESVQDDDDDDDNEGEIPPSILWLIFCFVCIVLGICLIFCKIFDSGEKNVQRNTNGGHRDTIPNNPIGNMMSNPPPEVRTTLSTNTRQENNIDDPWRPPDYESVVSTIGHVKYKDEDPPPPYPGI